MVVKSFVVPDEPTWALWGRDLHSEGFIAVGTPAAAEVLVAPESLPDGLVEAVRDAWSAMPQRRRLVTLPAPVADGDDVRDLLESGGHHGDGHPGAHGEHSRDEPHDSHAEHGDHDHHDMMAVTGEPSTDGLVMEPREFELGPLSPMFPAGVVASLVLDGDVVDSCELTATLRAPDPSLPGPTDSASAAARPGAERGGARIVEVELERAVSHAGWLVRLGRLLGWGELEDESRTVLRHAVAIAYAAANLAAFAVVLAVQQERRSVDLSAFAGLGRAHPWWTAGLILAFLSLLGLPPLAGFVGKLELLRAAIDADQAWLAVVAVVNTVVSLYPYLRVAAPAVLDGYDGSAPARPAGTTLGFAAAVAVVLTVAVGVGAEPLLTLAERATSLTG